MPCCSAYGCSNQSDRPRDGITYHGFPSEPNLRRRWIAATRRKNFNPSKFAKLCSKHFREEDLDRTSLCRVRVREGAVPSVFDALASYLKKKEQKRKPPSVWVPPSDIKPNTEFAGPTDQENGVIQMHDSGPSLTSLEDTPRKLSRKRKLEDTQLQLKSSQNMAMELTFLGTGAAYPSPQRGASSAVFRYEGKYWMFDCGEGTQIKLACSKVRRGQISKVFITHLHGDHIFGLPGLICSMSLCLTTFSQQTLEVFGPVGLRRFLRTALGISQSHLNFNYVVHELLPNACQLPADYKPLPDETDDHLHPNELRGSTIAQDMDTESWHVFEDDQFIVKAGILTHQVPCFGFVIQEKPSTGKLDTEKLMLMGIPPGKCYSKLKAGESIESPSGEIINPSDVLGPSQPGRKIAILGDTCNSSKMAALCQDVHVLVHEATLSNEMSANAIEKGHSTPEMAAMFANMANAHVLVLTHFSQRYKATTNDSENSVAILKEQAERVFMRKLIMAEDGLVLTIKKADPIIVNYHLVQALDTPQSCDPSASLS